MQKQIVVNERFRKGVEALKALERDPRYLAAFIFGSVAEGTSTSKSDLDAKVIVDKDNLCEQINHPVLDDFKFDLTFRSMQQIRDFVADEIREGKREPNLCRGLIVFDKTGELTELKESVRDVRPPAYAPSDHQWAAFMLYHANNKVERDLEDDPESALYSMHGNIGEVLKIHYRFNGRWWVSSKKMMADLRRWDPEMARLLGRFVALADPVAKREAWSRIIERVAAPMGGLRPIAEINCTCAVCAVDLARLIGK